MRNTSRNLGTIFALFVLLVAVAGFERLTSAQKPVTHPDGSTTTSQSVYIAERGSYGTKETTKDKDGNTTKEETKDDKGNIVKRVEHGANGTVRIWRYDRLGRVVDFIMKWSHGGPFGESGAIGREIKYKDDQDKIGTADDAAQVGFAGARRATDDESTFIGVAIKPDPLATPKPGSNEGPGKEPPAINVESILGDLFPSEKKKQTEQETPKSGASEPQTPTQPAPKPIPKFQVDPKYKLEFKASRGLNTETLILPTGTKIGVNFPDDVSAGDTFTGTVTTEVAGKDEKQRAKNQAEFEKTVLQIGGQPTRATAQIFTRTIPSTVNPDEPFLVVMVNGKQAASATLPIAQSPPATPQNLQLPTGGQMGHKIVVPAPCNGVFSPTDSAKVGGTELKPLAESPRMKVFENTSPVAGRTLIEFSEGGKTTTGPFQNIGVRLSGDTNLLRRQQGPLNLVIFGLLHMQQVLPVDLVNASTTVVGVSGGDIQHFEIQPTEISANGEWARNFTMTGRSAGVFNITATVRWKNPCQPGQPDCGGRLQPCGAGGHPCGEGLKYWCTSDDKPCQPAPCGQGAHRCGEGLKYWCIGDDKPCQPPAQPPPTGARPAASPSPRPGATPVPNAQNDKENVRQKLAQLNKLLDDALQQIDNGGIRSPQDLLDLLEAAEKLKKQLLNSPPFVNTSVLGITVAGWIDFADNFDSKIAAAKKILISGAGLEGVTDLKKLIEDAKKEKKRIEKLIR